MVNPPPGAIAGPSDSAVGRVESALRFLSRVEVVLLLSTVTIAVTLRYGESVYQTNEFPAAAAWDGRWWVESKVLFCLGCALTILVSRWSVRARDIVNIALGSAWWACVFGWRYVLGMTVVSAIVYVGARKLNPYLAMMGSALLLVLTFRFALPNLEMGHSPLLFGACGWMALRVVIYAFESKLIPNKNRSFLALLTYGPLGLLLWPGDPPCLSYRTYHTKRPRTELDSLGSRQIRRCAIKLVLLVVAGGCFRYLLPSPEDFVDLIGELPRPARIAPLLAVTWLRYLAISALADFVTGISNLSGYFAPDAYDRPFFASSPFEFWRTWNVHVLNFLRAAFIFPIARKRRSTFLIVLSGATGSILIHVLARSVMASSSLGVADLLTFTKEETEAFGAFAVALVVFIPFEARRIRLGLVGVVATQLTIGLLWFSANNLYGEVDDQPLDRCVIRSVFDGKSCRELLPPRPE